MSKDFGSKVDKLLGNYSKSVGTSSTERRKTTEGTVKRAYYLTPEQIKAIALKAATDDMTKNEVVQEALNQYLADFIEK